MVALVEQLAGGSASTPSRHAQRSEAVELLQQALEQLPEPHRTVVQLYDLARDPMETEELSAQYPERLAEMREALERYLASVDRSAAAADARELERALERLGYL